MAKSLESYRDFEDIEVYVGDTVAIHVKGYNSFVRAVVTKINPKKVTLEYQYSPTYRAKCMKFHAQTIKVD